MFTGQTILITGGTGSWGQELTKQLLEKYNPNQIIIFSRGELAQVSMQRKFNNPKLKFVIGDVRDFDSLDKAMMDADFVFHLAAMKHVPVCEQQPDEAIKTNITGTQNVIRAAIKNAVNKVIDVSTDKAVDPMNLYGMTKAVGERLIMQANAEQNQTSFVCIRGGNVIGSNGSVIPYFIDQLKRENTIYITDRRMTRFFMTLEEAIGLLFRATQDSFGGETYVMKMPSYYIEDVAKVLAHHYGNADTKFVQTGIRPGEKIDEVLVSKNESMQAYDDNEYIVIAPTLEMYSKHAHEGKTKLAVGEYSSLSNASKSHEKIEEMLRKSGFLK